MRNFLIIMTLLCTLVVGCNKEPIEEIEPPKSEGLSTVTFGVVSKEETETRATVLLGTYESKLHNYNLFCYHKESDAERHIYSSSASATTLILGNGDWDIFIIANTTTDLGDLSREEVENYTYTIAKTTDLTTGYKLVMAHHSTLSIGGDTSIELEVERLVARFDISIEFSGEAADYKIISTEVVNEAASCKLFGNNPPSSSVTPTFSNHIYGTMTFYVLENLQGVVSTITRPEDKNEMNSPENATHIKIYVQSSTHEIVYTYYLGGNTINDFNVERNTRYEITININGMDSDDMRVESTRIPGSDPVYEIRSEKQEKKYPNVERFILEFECGDQQSVDLEFEFLEKSPAYSEVEHLSRFMLNSLYTDPIETNTFFDERNLFEKIDGYDVSLSESSYLEENYSPPIYLTTHARATVQTNTKYTFEAFLWTADVVYCKVIVYMERGTENEKSIYLESTSYI
ncbi:MAG: DUF4906 domain-containing protein [Rikenellaceae bacterium]